MTRPDDNEEMTREDKRKGRGAKDVVRDDNEDVGGDDNKGRVRKGS